MQILPGDSSAGLEMKGSGAAIQGKNGDEIKIECFLDQPGHLTA